MKLSFFHKNIFSGTFAIFLIIFLSLAGPTTLKAQPDPHFILDHQDLIINVNNIATHGEISIRGKTANFPYPILSTISVVDSTGNVVIGLADTLRWLGPNDTAENGLPITQIWQPILEYHEEDTLIPNDPDIYHQTPDPSITEIRNVSLLSSCTMLVMDVSESMVEEIAEAKEGLRLYVRLFRPNDRGGIVQFSSKVVDYLPMTSDTSLLIQKINDANADGGTAIYDALMKAIDGIKCDRGRRSIIIYTDGEDRSSTLGPQAVIDSARIYNLPIYTIALGDSTQEDVLKQIADQTNGIFFKAATAEEMKIIYGKLSKIMQNYYVMAHASPDPFFNNTWRLVDVTVNLPNLEGQGIGRYFVGGSPANLNTDLAANLVSVTDTAIVMVGDSINAVKPGENYQYSLTAKNLGPNLADTVRIIHFLPDSLQFLNASILPDHEAGDSLEWVFTGVVPQREFNITVNVQLQNNIPRSLTDLVSELKVSAINDTNTVNNVDFDTVKVLFPELPDNYDLSLAMTSKTDTFALVDSDSVNAVFPGDQFSYVLTITNQGPNSADSMKLIQLLPDSVDFITANPSPQTINNDSLIWIFDNLQSQGKREIQVDVKLKDDLPDDYKLLISEANLFGSNDTTFANNFAIDTVQVLAREAEPYKNYDLSLSQSAISDTNIYFQDDSVKAVLQGDIYSYSLLITNSGPVTAHQITLWDVFPDSVKLSTYNIQPLKQAADSVFWFIDSLKVGEKFNITFNANVADNLPVTPFPLINESGLIAQNDTLAENNYSTTTVYGIRKKGDEKPGATDVALTMVSLTDTSIVVDGESYNAVKPGEKFDYSIKLRNNGPNSADSVKLIHLLPDSVRFLEATSQAQISNQDSLLWNFDSIQPGSELSITVSVQLSAEVPKEFDELISNAVITAINDTTENNNFASDIVKVLFPKSLVSLNYNLVTRQKVFPDTLIEIAGETVPAVLRGSSYRYHLIVKNYGPATARDFTLWDAIPDSIKIFDTSLSPIAQTEDSLFWRLDSLARGDSIVIALDVTVAESLPITPFPLINETGLIAEHDTAAGDNYSSSLIYAISRPDDPLTLSSDISARQSVLTDSFALAGNDTLRFARTGETYFYKIRVTNVSQVAAQDVKVVDILPDSITASNFQPMPDTITGDSLVWQLGILLPQTSVELLFDATVASNMPIGKNYLINEVKASASNEDPNRLTNNNSTSTVINLVKPGWDWQPYIEAMPQVVKAGNPITVRVKVTAPIDYWDLWVYLADGQIDSSYGDDFISLNPLVPDVWSEIDPAYSETRLYTEAKKEEIVFELRAKDVFGELKTATAAVTIESDDDLVIDRNVFIPDKENELPIKFKLSSDRQVRLEIYDITGTKITNVADGQFKAGWNTYTWNGLTDRGQKIGSGFYILTINSGEYQSWKKLMIVR